MIISATSFSGIRSSFSGQSISLIKAERLLAVKSKLFVAVLVAVAAILISSAAIANLSAGAKAPNITLPTLDGKSFTLANALKADKVVVLDIWATWCPPCRAEIPFIIKMNNKFGDKDVMIVGVAIDQDKSDVSSFVKKQKVDYTIGLDPNAAVVGDRYKVRGIPVTYIIDKKGIVRYVHSGFGGASDMAAMEKEIASLLGVK